MKKSALEAVGVRAEDLTAAQAKVVVGALRPMLKTLIGAVQCDRIVAQLGLELELRQ